MVDNYGGEDEHDDLHDAMDEDEDLDEENDSEVEIIDDEEGGNLGGGRGDKRVAEADRITSKFMTKYERARVLGTRAL
jgi:DNA-directed RNA polymerase I, II, and III subunit RPABC2